MAARRVADTATIRATQAMVARATYRVTVARVERRAMAADREACPATVVVDRAQHPATAVDRIAHRLTMRRAAVAAGTPRVEEPATPAVEAVRIPVADTGNEISAADNVFAVATR